MSDKYKYLQDIINDQKRRIGELKANQERIEKRLSQDQEYIAELEEFLGKDQCELLDWKKRKEQALVGA